MTAKGDTHTQIDGDILQCREEIKQLRKQGSKVIHSFEDIATPQNNNTNAKPAIHQTDDMVIRIKDGLDDSIGGNEDISNKTATDTSYALSIIENAVMQAEDADDPDMLADLVAKPNQIDNTDIPRADSHRLSPEEFDALTADHNEQADAAAEDDRSVPQFDLADQILFEHRKSVSNSRHGPEGNAKKTTPPAHGTVAEVINENKKKTVKLAPANAPAPAMQVMLGRTIDDSGNANRGLQMSPAVSNIVNGRESLSSLQRQILSDIINRDISSHCNKTNLSTAMKSYANN